jgi:ArsR family transcriptional regulator
LNYLEQVLSTSTHPHKLAEALKILAEPNRLVILDLLMQGVQCNCELGKKLNLPPNLISHHLNILRRAGWVDAERDPVDARWVYYSINQDQLRELSAQLSVFLDLSRCQPRLPECGPKITTEKKHGK